jgi:hypothetical protein
MLMRNRYSALLFWIIGCVAFLASALAQSVLQMPKIEGENLSGRKVVLPDAASGKIAVLVFGFTKASKTQTSAWASKLQADFGTRADFELYQLPVLESVPRMVRGMVISGMRKGVADDKRDHFVPLLQGEAELKKLVGYKEADDAYLVVLGRAGNILEQSHGAPDDANNARLRADLEAALNQK